MNTYILTEAAELLQWHIPADPNIVSTGNSIVKPISNRWISTWGAEKSTYMEAVWH